MEVRKGQGGKDGRKERDRKREGGSKKKKDTHILA